MKREKNGGIWKRKHDLFSRVTRLSSVEKRRKREQASRIEDVWEKRKREKD